MSIDAARDALLVDARRSAEQVLAEADAEAAEVLERAHRTGDELISAARARGRADGRIEASREEAHAHALARFEVLGAQRELYDELRSRVSAAVLELRSEPGYPELLERLAAAARRDLGEDAELEIDPPDVGGVRGRAGSRAVDYTLPALAERCLEALGPRMRQLWA